MKNPLLIIFLLINLFYLSEFSVKSQVNKCSLNLIEAKEKFNAGQIQEVPDLLQDCINKGFKPEDRIEAFKLLINAYIFDDYPELAEKYMMTFLNEYPEYKISESDSYEFVNLFQQFDNRPRYSIGGQAGTNMAHVRVIEPFGIYNINEVSGTYRFKAGFQLGGNFYYYINRNIELNFEAVYSNTRFKYEVNSFPFTKTEYTEVQKKIELPVSAVYSFGDKKISPYLRLGLNSSLLLSAKGESLRTYMNTSGVEFDEINGSATDISDKRVPFNISAFFGGGGRINIPKAFVFFDLRYNFGLTSQVIPESRRNTNDDNIWLFYNQQDDFSLNNFSFYIGYARKIYNPKRKK